MSRNVLKTKYIRRIDPATNKSWAQTQTNGTIILVIYGFMQYYLGSIDTSHFNMIKI